MKIIGLPRSPALDELARIVVSAILPGWPCSTGTVMFQSDRPDLAHLAAAAQ